MSGHEFEKQVRQKLNDLKMTPSTEAWENIENSLRERKRRPVAFYWVPLLLIGLAAGGYLFLNNDHKVVLSDKNSTPNVEVQPKAVLPKTVVKEKPSAVESVAAKNLPKKQLIISGEQSKENKNISLTKTNIVSPQENRDASGGFLDDVPQEKTLQNRKPFLSTFNYPIGTITASPFNSNLSRLNSNSSPLNFKPSPKKSSSKKANKWSYGLSAFAGISAVSKGHLLNFNNAQVEDVSMVPSFAPRPSYKPSSISPGFAFSAGMFVKRELSRRFSLSIGANYLQLNTRNKVGQQQYGSQIVNAGNIGFLAITNYFMVEQDNTSEYHNRYHFIEVPLELHTKVNRSPKHPIQVTTGVAVSQLMKSTSLHFDGTTGVYYKDDRLLNQTQVAAKMGVSIGILNKTTRPLWIGPSARYNVSKILEKDASARTNFMSVGVDVKMFVK